MTAVKFVLVRLSRISCLFSLLLAAEALVAQQKLSEMPPLPKAADFRESIESTITSTEPKVFDMFGATMRSVDRDGTRNLLVGHSRGVWELSRDESGKWVPVFEIKAPESCSNPGTFGMAFDVDGDTVVLRPVALGDKARIHVFRQTDSGWTHAQDITPSMFPDGRRFGLKVTAGDGWLCAHGRNGVTLFKKNEKGRYLFSQVIDSVEKTDADRERFGKTITVDGGQMIISSFRATGLNERVDVFALSPEGKWSHIQVLDPPHRKFGTWFGHALDVSGDCMVIASPRWRDMAGRVDVYRRGSDALWTHVQELAVFPDSLSSFGTQLSLEDDNLVVGASMPNVPGSAYVFKADSAGRFKRSAMVGLHGKEHISAGFGTATLVGDGRFYVSAPSVESEGFAKAGSIYEYPLLEESMTAASE